MTPMPKQFELLVFDWDGTLMDSAAGIAGSLRSACADLEVPVPSEERARYVIGLGLNDALKYLLPDFPVTGYPALLERYRFHFLRQDSDTVLFQGAPEMLRTLHDAGFMLAVATGKSRRGLDRALETTGLEKLFHATRCGDEGFPKPHPGMLLWLLDELNVDRARALMIGDTSHDMEMAQAAEVPRLGVAYGAHPRENLLKHDPRACLDTFAELAQWLTTHA
jgi:phosphoglycolate phosphatase